MGEKTDMTILVETALNNVLTRTARLQAVQQAILGNDSRDLQAERPEGFWGDAMEIINQLYLELVAAYQAFIGAVACAEPDKLVEAVRLMNQKLKMRGAGGHPAMHQIDGASRSPAGSYELREAWDAWVASPPIWKQGE